MRICHVIESAGGGSGQVVLDLLRIGAAAGDDLTIIYSPVRAEPYFVSELELLRGHIRIYTLPMRRELGVHDAWHALRLALLLRQAGPFDIINSHSSKAGALARIAGIFGTSAQVYTPHAFITLAPSGSKFYALAERVLSHLCAAIICVTQQEMSHARDVLHIATSKLHVVHNGARLNYAANRAKARERLGYGVDEFVVGFVGRLVEQKNPLRLVEVFAQAALHLPQLRLVIVGEGPLQGAILQALEEKNLEKRAHLVMSQNARSLMPGFDCLLCSSDYEGFGLVIVEALAAGVPVISTPVGIAAEDIIVKNMLISKDFSALTLARLLVELVTMDKDKRVKLSQIAPQIVRHLSIENMAAATKNVYTHCLSKR